MKTPTISISSNSLKNLEEMALLTGKEIPILIEQAIEEYKRKLFLEGLAQDFQTLRNDPKNWKEELEERALWDSVCSE